MIRLRSQDLSPEEYAAALGAPPPSRVKIWRSTYGPGTRPTGARFRDEVQVCTRCRAVTITRLLPGPECFGTTGRKIRRMDAMSPEAFRRHGHLLSDRQLKVLVDEPCDGIRMAPTAELGWRWLKGEEISV